jgi:hypothetical protein
MKNIFKILMAALILFVLSVGVVTALDIDDLTPPDDLEEGAGNYFENDDFELSVNTYDKDTGYEILFEDDLDYYVTVDDDMAEYTDELVGHVGVLEIVEIDGEECVVECYFDGEDESMLSDCHDYIDEFNELNDLEPLPIEK